MSTNGARQVLYDHYLVDKLTADLADLSAIIEQKDLTIVRLRKSIDRLTVANPKSAYNAAPESDIRIRPLARGGPAINWPKLESWGWRGLFLYLGVQAARVALSH